MSCYAPTGYPAKQNTKIQPGRLECPKTGDNKAVRERYPRKRYEIHERTIWAWCYVGATTLQTRINDWLRLSPKQYKDRIKTWGLNRNIKADEMESMIKIQQKRNLENKPTAFRVRKRPVNPGKIKRYMKDHPMPAFGANKDGNMDMSMDSAGMIVLP